MEKAQLSSMSEQAECLTLHFNRSHSVGHCANLTCMPTLGHRLSGTGSLAVVCVGEGKERVCCMELFPPPPDSCPARTL